MVPNSYSTREIIIAVLAGPPRRLTRQQGMAIHDAMCGRLGEDFSFKFNTNPTVLPQATSGAGFQIALERPQGRGKFQILVDHAGQAAPVRIYVGYPWPRGQEFEDIDLAFEAVWQVLGEGWTRVLVETRVRGQLEARGESAANYMAANVLQLTGPDLAHVGGQVPFWGVRYEAGPGQPQEGHPLANPKRELSLETLRDNPRHLYVELMSQWPQMGNAPTVVDGTLTIDASTIRELNEAPRVYIQDSMTYLTDVVFPLFSRA